MLLFENLSDNLGIRYLLFVHLPFAAGLFRFQVTGKEILKSVQKAQAGEQSTGPLVTLQSIHEVSALGLVKIFAPANRFVKERDRFDEAVVTTAQVCCSAAPSVVLQPIHRTGADGIHLDVAGRPQEVLVVHGEGRETTRPKPGIGTWSRVSAYAGANMRLPLHEEGQFPCSLCEGEKKNWRRRESNPRPRAILLKRLHT